MAKITWTTRATLVIKEAAEDLIRASQIIGVARITETLRAAEQD